MTRRHGFNKKRSPAPSGKRPLGNGTCRGVGRSAGRRPVYEALEDRRMLAVSPLGDRLAVDAAAVDYAPVGACTAMDADGNFVVVWQAPGQGLLGKRFDYAGALLGSFVVDATADSEADAAIAMAPSGEFVVVWTHSGPLSQGLDVVARRFDAQNNPLGDGFTVHAPSSRRQFEADVAIDDSGRFIVTWSSQHEDHGNDEIVARRFGADGLPLGDQFRVNVATAGDQTESDVATDVSGNFVVVWTSAGQDGDGKGVYFRLYDAQENALTGDEQVNVAVAADQFEPAVAMSNAGQFVVAWTDGAFPGIQSHVFMRRFDAQGSPLDLPANISDETPTPNNDSRYYQRHAAVAMNDEGDVVVAWSWIHAVDSEQFGTSYSADVITRRFNADGSLNDSNFLDNQSYNERPSVASSADDRFVVAWDSQNQREKSNQPPYGVVAQRFIVDGPDVNRPVSTMAPLDPEHNSRTIQIQLQGDDPEVAGFETSGLAAFDLYVSRDGAPYVKHATYAASYYEVYANFTAEWNHTYAFRSIARDHAGNEEQKTAPDAVTHVRSRGDFDRTGSVDGADFLLWQRQFGGPVPAPGDGADAYPDGLVDDYDLYYWTNHFGVVTSAVAASAAALTAEASSTATASVISQNVAGAYDVAFATFLATSATDPADDEFSTPGRRPRWRPVRP